MNLRRKFEQTVVHSNTSQPGFILPALVVFSLILVSMGVVALQYITASSSSVQSTNFTSVAKSAADAGIQHALSCLEKQVEDWDTLRPNTDCAGVEINDNIILSESGAWQSTYEVASAEDNESEIVVTSTGRVDFFYAGASEPSKTFTATSKATVPVVAVGNERPMASGNVVTKVSAGNGITCAIANMQLYCSGGRQEGRMADGGNVSTSPYVVPTRINVTGQLTDTVTDIQVNSFTHCAIAGGQSYCWGRNNMTPTGNGGTQTYIGPTVPNSVANFDPAQTRIASPGKSWDNPSQYACFLNQLRVFCSGANNTAQLGRVFIQRDCSTCAWYIRNDPHVTTNSFNAGTNVPLQVYGYATANESGPTPPYNNSTYLSQSKLFNSRPTHLESGAYQACTLINSRAFCWGDRFVTASADAAGRPADRGNVKADSGWRISDSGPTSAMGVGESTSCLVSNGELYCWGFRPGDGTRKPTFFAINNATSPHERWALSKASNGSGTDLSGVNVEGFHSHSDNYMCAYGDGDAYCWGPGSNSGNVSPNTNTPARVIAGSNLSTQNRANVTDVAAGFDQICVVANGSQYCRGYNSYNSTRRGVLGTGNLANYTAANYTTKSSNTIGLTNDGEAATKIASGDNHSCAIANNYVYCWGSSSHGQVGDGSLIARTQPHGIAQTGDFNPRAATHITAGARHSCAIISGDVYCWGDNTYGQLGRGSIGGHSSQPVRVTMPGGYKATSIDAGAEHTCAIANGRAYCWGRNNRAQLGNSSTATNRSTPHPVTNLSSGNPANSPIPTRITTGANFSCALANAYVYCWGDNTFGQAGLPASSSVVAVPNQVGNGSPVTALQDEWMAVDAGSNFVCGAINQVVRCWGSNSNGQLGRNTTTNPVTNPHIPATVTTAATNTGQNVGWKKTTRLTAGTNHACAIADGAAYCWGNNTNGKLGEGSITQQVGTRLVTRQPGYLVEHNIYDISAGGNHTCGIANGRIICWGLNSSGQLGDTTTTTRSLANRWQGPYLREGGRSLDVSGATVF